MRRLGKLGPGAFLLQAPQIGSAGSRDKEIGPTALKAQMLHVVRVSRQVKIDLLTDIRSNGVFKKRPVIRPTVSR